MVDGSNPLVIYSNTTPNGTVVEYSPAPRRFYRVNGVEVPSVTTVLGCLDKPSLPWWGMKVGVGGVLELYKNGSLTASKEHIEITDEQPQEATEEDVVRLLTEHKLTVNHVRDRAGDRGTSVHDAFEQWCLSGTMPDPVFYPESEKGYVTGLVAFLNDLDDVGEIKAEVMVGSVLYRYAGRFDLRCYLTNTELVTRTFPKKDDARKVIPSGRYLLDLKTSSGVYQTHALQLEAYELASRECGYEWTDYRAVIRVTSDGKYEFRVTKANFLDFLSVRETYDVVKKRLV